MKRALRRATVAEALASRCPPEEWRARLGDAASEGVGAWLAEQLARHDPVFAAQWRPQRKWLAAEYARKAHALAHAARALEKAGIRFLLLRGPAVGIRYWGNPVLRPFGDLDLLVAPESFRAAKDALWNIGFRPDRVYAHLFVRGDVQLDLHREPLGIDRIRSWARLTPLRFDELWEHHESIVLEGCTVPVPAMERELAYLCFHALKHSFERLVWLWDIALAARAMDEDRWQAFLAFVRAMRLERPCFYALSYAQAHLAAPVPDAVLGEIRPRMGRIEARLFARVMRHDVPPFLAERVFARMQPSLAAKIAFWRETIWPAYEVRAQIAGSGCVKCNFIRKRLKQAARWALDLASAPLR